MRKFSAIFISFSENSQYRSQSHIFKLCFLNSLSILNINLLSVIYLAKLSSILRSSSSLDFVLN